MKSTLVSERFDVLDGWRTISVGMVVVSHFLEFSVKPMLLHPGPAYHELSLVVSDLGRLGVEVFFVISGFVICRGFLREERERIGVSLSGFYLRRTFRILPPLCTYVFFVWLLSQLGLIDSEARSIVRALTFTCNFDGTSCGGWYGGHMWSLSIEEQFYLAFPLIFIAMGRRRGVGVLMLAGSVCVIVLLQSALRSSAFWMQYIGSFLPISIGVVCAVHEPAARRLVGRIPSGLVYAGIPVAILLSRLGHTQFGAPFSIAEAFVVATTLLMSLEQPTHLRGVLESKPIVAIGRSSYSIYLWQQLALTKFAEPAFYLFSVSATVIGSLVSFKFAETRLIRQAAKWSKAISHPLRQTRPVQSV